MLDQTEILRELNVNRMLGCIIVGLQLLVLIVSLTKLLMMRSVTESVKMNTATTDQYIHLTQQYADLYVRETRECEHVIVNAAKAMTETVERGVGDSGEILTTAQAARLQQRLDNYKKKQGVT